MTGRNWAFDARRRGTTLRDIFEPTQEPAKTSYRAFQQEAKKRKGRDVEEWIQAERDAVHAAACEYARHHDLHEPTLEEVAAAERYAVGSADYGAKWVYQVASLMR